MRTGSLMLQLSIAVVMISTLVLTGFGFYRYKADSRVLNARLVEELNFSVERLSGNLGLTLFNYSDEGSRNIMIAEMANRNIQGIVMQEIGMERPMFSFARGASGNVVPVDDYHPREDALSGVGKIRFEGEELGEVRVYMTTRYLEERLTAGLISMVVEILLLDSVLITLVILILKEHFVRPVTRLTTAAAEIARGDLDHPISSHGHGEICVLANSFSAMRDSVKSRISDLNLEISERKRAEEDLLKLRNYLKNIVDSMPSVLVGVDVHGKVTQWNLKAESWTGIPSDKAQGLVLQDVFPLMAREMEKVKIAVSGRETIKDSKVPSMVDGEERFADITIYPLIANGSRGAVIRIDDVTDKVRMEEMMIQSEKMLSVGGLAAGMAHEINNPLAGIMQNIQVMENRMKPDLPKNRRVAEECGISMEAINRYMNRRNMFTMISAIVDSGLRASKIVDNMLSFSRKSKSRVTANSLPDLLDQTIELVETDYDMKKKYDFKQIKIVREYQENMPEVPCEGGKIQQVFLNILKNGAQAMWEDGRVAKSPPEFILRIREEKKMACVEIQDNGPGMDEAVRKRVFEPFFTTKDVGMGTGLGMSVSYFIITENHNGTLDVISSPGHGSNFVINLPLEYAS